MAASVGTYSTAGVPKLDGNNYQSWKEMVTMILKLRKIHKAIEDLTGNEQVDPQQDLEAKLVLMETMDQAHRDRIKGCTSAKDVMVRLAAIYSEDSAANKGRLLARYYRYKMAPEDSMSVHLGKMDGMRRALADLKKEPDEEVHQITILGSLPPEYEGQMSIWELTHPDMKTTAKLVSRLLKKEEDLKASAVDHVFVAGGTRRKAWKDMTIEERKKVSRCKKCNQKGHWANECPNQVGAMGNVVIMGGQVGTGAETTGAPVGQANSVGTQPKGLMVLQQQGEDQGANYHVDHVNFNVSLGNPELKGKWLADSGASNHMCNNKGWFSKLTLFDQPKEAMVGDGKLVLICGYGSIEVIRKVGRLSVTATLQGVSYIPDLATNLFSVGVAAKQGIVTTFDGMTCTMKKDGKLVAEGKQWGDNLYVLNMQAVSPRDGPGDHDQGGGRVSNYLVKRERTLREWHEALGHASEARVRATAANLGLTISDKAPLNCPDCPVGGAQRATHQTRSTERAEMVGAQVHTDLCYIANKNENVYTYYLVAKDEASEFTFVYLLTSKSDVCNTLAQLLIDFEIGSGRPIKSLHSDNGSEFTNERVKLLLLQNGVNWTSSAVYTPEQNGIAEREIQTIDTMARKMLISSGLPMKLIGEAIKAACYLKNRLPTSRSQATPYERFRGHKPDLTNLIRFGQPVQVLCQGHYLTKFEPRTEPGFVVGHTPRRNTYRVYMKGSGRLVETCNIFLRPHAQSQVVEGEGPREDVVRYAYLPHLEPVRLNSTNTSVSSDSSMSPVSSISVRSIDRFQRLNEGELNEPYAPAPAPSAQSIQPQQQQPTGRRPITVEELDRFFERYLHSGSSPRSPSLCEADAPSTLEMRRADRTTGGDDSTPPEVPPADYSEPEELSSHTPAGLMLLGGSIDEPKTVREVMTSASRKQWLAAISDELNAHRDNNTWEVVRRPDKGTTITGKWVFTIKRDNDGKIEKYKARLVARGFEQRLGQDFAEIFAPVAKLQSLRIILALCANKGLHFEQFDVSNAYLHSKLDSPVYMEAPEAVEVGVGECLKLTKALYGLRQAPKAWNSKFHLTIVSLGFQQLVLDSCVYYNRDQNLILLIYVDDGLICGPDKESCLRIIDELNKHFKTRHVTTGVFLGMSIKQSASGITLGQQRYARDVLAKFNMTNASPVSTPLVNAHELVGDKGATTTTAPYRQAVGCLQYLACCTRPDLMYAVNFLSSFNSQPTELHWSAVKRVLRYLAGTTNKALLYPRREELEIDAFSDASWASTSDMKSISGSLILLSGGAVIFHSRKQSNVAISTAEAEYVAAAETTRDATSLVQFLEELGICPGIPRLLVDNQAAIAQIKGETIYKRSRHIDIKYHKVRDEFKKNKILIQYVDTANQSADLLTKPILSGPTICHLATQINLKNITEQQVGLITMNIKIPNSHQVITKGPNIMWAPSIQHFVPEGLEQYHVRYDFSKLCSFNLSSSESTYNLKQVAFANVHDLCKRDLNELWLPKVKRLPKCAKEHEHWLDTLFRRVKRHLVVWFVVILAFVALTGGLTASTLIAEGQISDLQHGIEDVKGAIETLKASTHNNTYNIGRLANTTEYLMHVTNNNTKAITEAASYLTDASWTGSKLQALLHESASSLDDLYDMCSKEGKVDIKALGKLLDPSSTTNSEYVKKIKTFNSQDTRVVEIEQVGESAIEIVFNVDHRSTHQAVYRIETFDLWDNSMKGHAITKYVGPKWIVHNNQVDCTIGIPPPEPHERAIQTSCNMPNFTDPDLQLWQTFEAEPNRTNTRPQVKKDSEFSYVYCAFSNITVNDKWIRCPPWVLQLPINQSFNTSGHNHTVSVVHLETAHMTPVVYTKHINTTLNSRAFNNQMDYLALTQNNTRMTEENLASQHPLIFDFSSNYLPAVSMLAFVSLLTGGCVYCYMAHRSRGAQNPNHITTNIINGPQPRVAPPPYSLQDVPLQDLRQGQLANSLEPIVFAVAQALQGARPKDNDRVYDVPTPAIEAPTCGQIEGV